MNLYLLANIGNSDVYLDSEEIVKQWITDNEYNLGGIMNALRLSLVGAPKGPHLFDITEIIGKEETIKRIQNAIDNI